MRKVLVIAVVLVALLLPIVAWAVPITCNCPFKDPTACKWWCSIL